MSGYDVIDSERVPIKAWTRGVPIEDAALQQLKNVASLPFIHKHLAVMPDVHWGKGATVGSVIPTVGAIIPAAVGVDIGCGMMAVRTSIRAEHLPDDLSGIRSAIEAAVPHGRTDNGGRNDKGAWAGEPPASAVTRWADLKAGYDAVVEAHPKAAHPRGFGHLGTLGTGNHFIELCLDEAGDVWVMLHSGSRGVGNRFGTYFIERAKHEMRRWHINLPDQDLAYFPEGTDGFIHYVRAVSWAQKYARANREVMMDSVLTVLKAIWPDRPLARLSNDHTLYRSFFLLERPFGRIDREPHLWGMDFDDRSPVVYGRNDLFGAFGRDSLGNWLLPVYPGGAAQREMAFRLGINVLMYATCLNYKRDQVHTTAILRRRRWKVDQARETR